MKQAERPRLRRRLSRVPERSVLACTQAGAAVGEHDGSVTTDATSAAKEIDAIISAVGGWRGATLADLRRIILSASPEIVEEIKWRKPSKPEGVATWVLDGNICMADLLKNAVRLTFPKGAQAADPHRLFNTRLDSKTVRAIDVLEDSKVEETSLRQLILDSIAANRAS